MTDGRMSAWALFKLLLVEDWRLHSEAFGGLRFAAFPVQIAVIVAFGSGLVTVTSIDPEAVQLGVHLLVGLFGVHIGSTAFEGTDALENVVGDVTYLLFSTRILPVSPRTVFGIFLLTDILYYAVLFILPITIGLVPLFVFSTASLTVSGLVASFLTLVLMFVFGAAVSVIGVSILTIAATKPRVGVVAGVGIAVGVSVIAGLVGWNWTVESILQLTPYGIHAATDTGAIAVSLGSVLASVGVAVTVYSPGRSTSGSVRVRGSDAFIRRLLPDRIGRLPTKMLLDVSRSSGGILKVAAVAGVVGAVAAIAIWGVESALGISVRPGVAFGSVLSVTSFTTYTWLTQFDDPSEYVFHPVSIRDVFYAKYVAFSVLLVPVGIIYYGAAVSYFGATIADAVVGAIVFLGMSVYVFGITVLLAGLDPNEFLFDTVSYAAFAIGLVVGTVPPLIASFLPDVGVLGNAAIATWCVVLAAVGLGACWAAPRRWEQSYRVS